MVIFLAGAHGVGKSFLGKPVTDSLGIAYAAASTLIREELGSANWDNDKRVNNVDVNQEALISAVSRIADVSSRLVLDGHFVLRNKEGNLVALPVDVFRRLRIKGVILLEAPANVVVSRLAVRGAPQSLTEVEEIASAELQHSEWICSELQIPLIRLLSPTEGDLHSALKQLMF